MTLRRQTLSLLVLIGLATSLPGAPEPQRDLEPIPRPDLSGVEAAVRRQLEAQWTAVEELGREGGAPGRLAEGYGNLGRLYYAYELSTAAAACYRNARRLTPGDFRWPYYLGFQHQVEGDLEQAAEHLEAAHALRPDDLPALLRLTAVEVERERYDRARALFERALELDPGAAAAHHGLGRIAAREGDPTTAVRAFERVLELQPQATLVHYPLALAYRELGEEEKARRHLGLRGDVAPTFPDPLVQAIDEHAVGVGLRLTRAGVALAEGREEAALEELEKAVASDPASPDARLGLGLALARGGDLEGARAHLEEAVRLDDSNVLAREALGHLLARTGDDSAAVPHFERAVEIAPDYADGLFQLGAALGRLGRHREAAAAFSRVLELDPRHTEARLARATSRIDVGELAGAREDLEALLAHDPQNATARLRLGETLQRLGDDGAFAEYLRAIDIGLEPQRAAAAHLSAGNLLARRREHTSAIDHFRSAVELDPDLVAAHYNLGGALSELGDLAAAAKSYARVLELQPDNASASLYSAAALAALGRHPEAREQLEKGLDASPGDGRLAHALARTLASCPDRSLRDGRRAVELALGVLRAQQSLTHAETVAMAFAESGRFDEAVKWQREVIAAVEAAGGAEGLGALRDNLARYERGEACCAGE